jgi:hypothetical protein
MISTLNQKSVQFVQDLGFHHISNVWYENKSKDSGFLAAAYLEKAESLTLA